jgi:hypothetical protein
VSSLSREASQWRYRGASPCSIFAQPLTLASRGKLSALSWFTSRAILKQSRRRQSYPDGWIRVEVICQMLNQPVPGSRYGPIWGTVCILKAFRNLVNYVPLPVMCPGPQARAPLTVVGTPAKREAKASVSGNRVWARHRQPQPVSDRSSK